MVDLPIGHLLARGTEAAGASYDAADRDHKCHRRSRDREAFPR